MAARALHSWTDMKTVLFALILISAAGCKTKNKDARNGSGAMTGSNDPSSKTMGSSDTGSAMDRPDTTTPSSGNSMGSSSAPPSGTPSDMGSDNRMNRGSNPGDGTTGSNGMGTPGATPAGSGGSENR